MALNAPIEAVTADDAQLRDVLREAHLPSLLVALAMVTGDEALIPAHLRPDITALFDPNAGLTEADLEEARELAFQALRRYRDGGCVRAPDPDKAQLLELMTFLIGDPDLIATYREFFIEELGLGGLDPRAPQWSKDVLAPDRLFTVAVIGAGMSGLAAAHRLGQAGVDHVVFEKNSDLGGTWWENTYPGCRVDVPSHLYSYTFATRDDWPQLYSKQEALLAYFNDVADDLDLRDRIRFNTEVREARWDEGRGTWALTVSGPGGDETLEVNAIISAVGQLNRPSMPTIEGIETFAGPSFHSAQWDHSVDLHGRRVGVIGTGASATQFVPEIAPDVDELVVFQRTPNWIAPSDDYHSDTPEGLRWLMRHVPTYAHWYRLWLFWRMADGLLPAARVDPAWDGDDRAVSWISDAVRQLLTEYIEQQLPDDPELAAQVTPTYPPASKRIVRDSGKWLGALSRDNVTLVTDAIDSITPGGVVAGGVEHPVDVLVHATGFQASNFLTPMRLVGRDGVELHERWDGDARAYMGITVPQFPNLFLLYGPNTNIVLNGSIIFFSECEVDYVLGCVRLLLEGDHHALDCRADVHDAYNERIDAGNQSMVWGVTTANSWYRNAKGRISQNWPFSLLEFWEQTRAPDPADYELL
jgi:4-hydroxyacetophenone monooxygenase